MSNFQFTAGQDYALSEILNDVKLFKSENKRDNKYRVLDGYSGTGKSTILPFIIKEVGSYFSSRVVLAPTNKAVGVIKTKISVLSGIDASYKTLHSVLYGPPDKEGMFIFKNEKIHECLVIIDECSMISEELYKDIQSKFVKSYILFVGDSFQLEPINSINPLYKAGSLLWSERLQLTEVCRYDAGIAHTANLLRASTETYPTVSINSDVMIKDRMASAKDLSILLNQDGDGVCLTATNKTRKVYNDLLRKVLKKDPDRVYFDYLIAVNNSNIMSNGEVFLCGNAHPLSKFRVKLDNTEVEIHTYSYDFFGESIRLVFVPDLTAPSLHLRQLFTSMPLPDFVNMCGKDNVHTATGITKNVVVCTWGYAISTFKSQGSQWDHVFVDFDYHSSNWDANRWMYTAITRAAKQVNIVPSPFIKFN